MKNKLATAAEMRNFHLVIYYSSRFYRTKEKKKKNKAKSKLNFKMQTTIFSLQYMLAVMMIITTITIYSMDTENTLENVCVCAYLSNINQIYL